MSPMYTLFSGRGREGERERGREGEREAKIFSRIILLRIIFVFLKTGLKMK